MKLGVKNYRLVLHEILTRRCLASTHSLYPDEVGFSDSASQGLLLGGGSSCEVPHSVSAFIFRDDPSAWTTTQCSLNCSKGHPLLQKPTGRSRRQQSIYLQRCLDLVMEILGYSAKYSVGVCDHVDSDLSPYTCLSFIQYSLCWRASVWVSADTLFREQSILSASDTSLGSSIV
ncbi:hypothetical protein H4582DRAFT_1458191 [Lactarius indigo]|nr:hypothetical protein H4582DRAFT_1458191 [Lactarius indigo]